jgi:hypothetical protein
MAQFFIKEKINQPNPKVVFPTARDIIDYNFSIKLEEEIIDYFSFNDFNNIPCERGFNCLAFYNELQMRCSREYLKAFSDALDNTLNAKNIKLTDIFKLNQQMKERLEYLHEPEIAYKLCSVVFFDGSENPYRYDFKHGLKKAELFKTTPMNDFFLSTPIVTLMPYISSWSNDLSEYCQMINQMTSQQIQDISKMLSEVDKSKEYYKLLESLVIKDSL